MTQSVIYSMEINLLISEEIKVHRHNISMFFQQLHNIPVNRSFSKTRRRFISLFSITAS